MSTPWGPRAQLALDTIGRRPEQGIPSFCLFLMEHRCIEELAGVPASTYRQFPEETYLAMQQMAGTCMIDQYIPLNPLTMGSQGFDATTDVGATTGGQAILDEIVIDSPEAVIAHLESVQFPRLRAELRSFSQHGEYVQVQAILAQEAAVQKAFGPNLLKVPYGIARFPILRYVEYGYVPYFTAYALYPEVMEQDFALQADVALQHNRAALRAYQEGGLPPLLRSDHDVADSRGTLVSLRSLDRLWFPQFARSMAPILQGGIRVIWHCDGNLMQMAPRFLEVGLQGFQGFQYEDGMDYPAICRMKTRDGQDPIIWAGVSVTRTLPYGTPADVRRELRWLVEHGPSAGLFLGVSSSIVPGVPMENIRTLVEGLQYYQTHDRRGMRP